MSEASGTIDMAAENHSWFSNPFRKVAARTLVYPKARKLRFVRPGTFFTPTAADMTFDVSATTPSNGIPLEDEIALYGLGGSFTGPTMFCSAAPSLGALHMRMNGGVISQRPTVKVGELINLSLVRVAPDGAQTDVTSGITWSLPGAKAVVDSPAPAFQSQPGPWGGDCQGHVRESGGPCGNGIPGGRAGSRFQLFLGAGTPALLDE